MHMKDTWFRGWRPVLKKSDSWERGFLLNAERQAERKVLEEEVYRRCAASVLGLVDCSELRVSCKLGRWKRKQRRLYVECVCLLQPTGERFSVYWRSSQRPRD